MSTRHGSALVLATLFSLPALAGDWPQWYGPERNGTAVADGVFSAAPFELEELWRRPVGGGISALAVHGERLYSLAEANGAAHAFALDAATGKELWRAPLGPSLEAQEWGAPSTPATDGASVFVLSPTCKLLALETATGTPRWQHDLKAEYNPGAMPTGCWSSPLLADGLLVVHVNGEPDKRVVAFNPATGAIVWASAAPPRAVRSSPALAEIAGVRQVLVHGGKDEKGEVVSLALSDGALLWRHAFPDADSYSFDTPLVGPGGLIGVPTWNDFRVIRASREGGAWKSEALWSTRAIRAEVQPFNLHAVFAGGLAVGFGNDLLSALDAATGAPRWQEKVYPGSVIALDGHLVVVSQAAGLLRVIKATAEGYLEVARKEVFPPGVLSDTPPSFAGRRLFLRNAEEIVALEVVPRVDRAR